MPSSTLNPPFPQEGLTKKNVNGRRSSNTSMASHVQTINLKLNKFDTFLFNIIKISLYLKKKDSDRVDGYLFRVNLNLYPDDSHFGKRVDNLHSAQELDLKKQWLNSIKNMEVPNIDKLQDQNFNIEYYLRHNMGLAKSECINHLINSEFYNFFIYLLIVNIQDEDNDTITNNDYHTSFNKLLKRNLIETSDQAFNVFKDRLKQLNEANIKLDNLITIATASKKNRISSVSYKNNPLFTKNRIIYLIVCVLGAIGIYFYIQSSRSKASLESYKENLCRETTNRAKGKDGNIDKSLIKRNSFIYFQTERIFSEHEAKKFEKDCSMTDEYQELIEVFKQKKILKIKN